MPSKIEVRADLGRGTGAVEQIKGALQMIEGVAERPKSGLLLGVHNRSLVGAPMQDRASPSAKLRIGRRSSSGRT